MAREQELRRPPITEALVDFRTSPTRPLDETAFGDAIREMYPKKRSQHEIKAQLRVEKDKPVSSAFDRELLGYHYLSRDERSIAQFRRNGFTYNRLSPYPGGDAVLDDALKLWAVYVEIAAPNCVSRLALRYINHLTLPTGEQAGKYLFMPPTPPEGTGHLIEAFLNRVRSHDPETGLKVTTSVASAPAKPGTKGSGLIVDIDAYRLADIGVAGDELRPVLESLRSLKNRAFFGSITDATVELLNGDDANVRSG